MREPSIFISHGSPMNLIEENRYTKDLKEFAKTLQKPKAILVLSAHWYGDGLKVSTGKKSETIYDFYGFPRELYKLKYEPMGSPSIAKRVAQKIEGIEDASMGLDHGAWAVLKYLFPKEDVPVFQVSIDLSKSYSWHFQLGEKLKEFREEGVMVLGSGNVSHNLGNMKRDSFNSEPDKWAEDFSLDFKKGLLEDNNMLIDPENNLQNFKIAHPTVEHYLPLLTVLGSRFEDEKVRYIHEGFQHGNLDMGSFILE